MVVKERRAHGRRRIKAGGMHDRAIASRISLGVLHIPTAAGPEKTEYVRLAHTHLRKITTGHGFSQVQGFLGPLQGF